LRWNDYDSNVTAAFRELRAEADFFDCVLACDGSGGRTLQAHKVVLSACSAFFKSTFKSPSLKAVNNPTVYLRGVKLPELEAVLDFMYHGEVNVAQAELSQFLSVAEDLQVRGLTQTASGGALNAIQRKAANMQGARRIHTVGTSSPQKRQMTTQEVVAAEEGVNIVKHEGGTATFTNEFGEEYTTTTTTAPAATTEFDYATATATEEIGETDSTRVTDLNELVAGLITFENGIHTCNLCGKKSPWRTTILRHMEANHVETAGHVCDICGNVSKTRHAFAMHKKRAHEDKNKAAQQQQQQTTTTTEQVIDEHGNVTTTAVVTTTPAKRARKQNKKFD